MKGDWRQGIIYTALMGMVASWLYVLVALLNKQVAGDRLSVLGLLLFYPLSFGISWLLARSGWHSVSVFSLSWFTWAIATLLAIKVLLFSDIPLFDRQWLLVVPRALAEVIYVFKPELLIPLITGVAWWLGQRHAHLRLSFAHFVTEFQFGLVILLITLFAIAMLEITMTGVLTAVLTFFSLALMGASLTHAQEGPSWLSGRHQGHWSGLLLISLGVVLILGLLVSAVVTPDLLQLFLNGLKWVWGLIIKILEYLASLLPKPGPVEPLPAMPAPPGGTPSEEFHLWTMPESVRSSLRLGWTILVVGFILFALWRVSSDIFGWLRRRLVNLAGAEYEPLPGAFRADFLSLLKYLLGKLLGLRWLFHRAKAGAAELATARQIYRRLLRWTAARGYPRHLAQTPHEFLKMLSCLLPEMAPDLKLITERYSATRYGASLLSREELHQMNESWHNIRRSQLKKARHGQEEEAKLNGQKR